MPAPSPLYTDLTDAQAFLDQGSNMSANDMVVLSYLLPGVEDFIERYTRRQFHPEPALDGSGGDTGTAVAKTFTTRGRNRVRLPDLRSVTSITLNGAALNNMQYWTGESYPGPEPATEVYLTFGNMGLGAIGAFAYVAPLGYRPNDLVVTGRWGWLPPPPVILEATYTLCARAFRERDASYADTVQTPEGGLLAYFRDLPARIQAELLGLRVPNMGVL